jgi:hypothetical protein
VPRVSSANSPHENLSQSIYWASVNASGSRLCNRPQSAKYGEQFEGRFGKRIRALMKAHEARYGRDPPFIVATSCILRRRPSSEAEMDRWHAIAMDDFDKWLTATERRKP